MPEGNHVQTFHHSYSDAFIRFIIRLLGDKQEVYIKRRRGQKGDILITSWKKPGVLQFNHGKLLWSSSLFYFMKLGFKHSINYDL